MRPDDRCVNEGAEFVHVEPQRLEDGFPTPRLRPAVEAIVDRLPVAEPLGQVPPLHPSPHAPHHSVDEVTVPSLRARAVPGAQQRLDAAPLGIAQLMSAHSPR